MNAAQLSSFSSVFTILFIITLIVSIIASAGIVHIKNMWTYAVTAALLILCMVSLAGSTYNPFIYFRF